MAATGPLRSGNNLFVATLRPHKAVGASTVGRWIKNGLRAVGIDLAILSAYSTRGASASEATSSGIPVESILRRASWAAASTFSRFYNRSVDRSFEAPGRLNGAWSEFWQSQ